MALSLHKKKRSFNAPPESNGGNATGIAVHFVVQQHAASGLHYAFRLERGSVLKSWAVPKGPSVNLGNKRLAMMVEDHPYDYRTFEGIIPEENFGAGTLFVWDEGIYEALEGLSKKEREKLLLKQIKSGSLKFSLQGSKLKGEFALVTKKNKSVVSKKTLGQVAKTTTNIYGKK